jgi:hypothetical protein
MPRESHDSKPFLLARQHGCSPVLWGKTPETSCKRTSTRPFASLPLARAWRGGYFAEPPLPTSTNNRNA